MVVGRVLMIVMVEVVMAGMEVVGTVAVVRVEMEGEVVVREGLVQTVSSFLSELLFYVL